MTELIPPRDLSDLIGAIYDCALDPDLWQRTLAAIAEIGSFHTAQLALVDKTSDQVLISRSHGLSHSALQSISNHLEEINYFLQTFLHRSPDLETSFVMSHDLSPRYLTTSSYVREIRAGGIVDILQLFFLNTPERFSGLGLGRNASQGLIGDREVRLTNLLLPHLRRAVTISNVLDARAIERARIGEALDALRCGVVLSDERGGVLHANRSAERMLSEGVRLRVTRGVLRAGTPAASKELLQAIRIAARNESAIGGTGLAVRLDADGAPPCFAHVLPIAGSDVRTRLSPTAVAAVFVGAPPNEADTARAMTSAYDLTPAETRVLASLLAGRTMLETASALGVAATTAKTHLENIFAKTGVTRQAELIRLATRIEPPAWSA